MSNGYHYLIIPRVYYKHRSALPAEYSTNGRLSLDLDLPNYKCQHTMKYEKRFWRMSRIKRWDDESNILRLHHKKFSEDELAQQKSVVFNNTINAMVEICRFMAENNYPFEKEDRKVRKIAKEGLGGYYILRWENGEILNLPFDRDKWKCFENCFFDMVWVRGKNMKIWWNVGWVFLGN